MNKLFQVMATELSPSESKLRPFPCGAAEELLVLACLGPLVASKIAVPSSDRRVYATDASSRKGGLVYAQAASFRPGSESAELVTCGAARPLAFAEGHGHILTRGGC